MKPRGNLREDGGQDDLREDGRLFDAEVLRDLQIDGVELLHGGDSREQHGEERCEEDDDDGRRFADAEEEHDEGQPGDG